MGERLPSDPAGGRGPVPGRSRVCVGPEEVSGCRSVHRSSARAPSISDGIMAKGCHRVAAAARRRSYAGGVDLRAWITAEHDGLRDRFAHAVAAHVPPAQWRERAGDGGSSIAWLVLHSAWHEDLAMQAAVQGGEPLLATWRADVGLGRRRLPPAGSARPRTRPITAAARPRGAAGLRRRRPRRTGAMAGRRRPRRAARRPAGRRAHRRRWPASPPTTCRGCTRCGRASRRRGSCSGRPSATARATWARWCRCGRGSASARSERCDAGRRVPLPSRGTRTVTARQADDAVLRIEPASAPGPCARAPQRASWKMRPSATRTPERTSLAPVAVRHLVRPPRALRPGGGCSGTRSPRPARARAPWPGSGCGAAAR